MGSSEFVDVTNVETTYDPFAKNNIPQNPSAQFAATSQNSQVIFLKIFKNYLPIFKAINIRFISFICSSPKTK